MPRYLDTAAEIVPLAKHLMEFIHEETDRPAVAELIARIVNLGIRCSPRGVQHTVRLNAVRAAVKGLPVRVGMVEKEDPKTGRKYNALTTERVTAQPNEVVRVTTTVEGPSEED